jgi:hypothetical protein
MAGPRHRGGEQVGQARAGGGESGEGQPHLRDQRGDQHARAGGEAAEDQDAGAAEVLDQGGAGKPPGGLGEREGRVARGGQAGARAEIRAEVQCPPVADGALVVGGAQRDQAEQAHRPARGERTAPGRARGGSSRAGARGARGPRGGTRANQGPRGDGGDEQAGQRDQQQVPCRGQMRGDQAAGPGARQPAEAPRGVEPGHDGTADGGDHLDRDAVHRDVETAVPGPEDQQREAQRDGGMRERREYHGAGERGAGDHRHRPAAEPPAEHPGDQHRGHGPGRQAEQREAEGGGRRAGLLLDGGNADRPAREDEAVHREHRAERDAHPGELAPITPGALDFVYQQHKIRLCVPRRRRRARHRRQAVHGSAGGLSPPRMIDT